MLEFHAEQPQATVNEGLAQAPYAAARVGFERVCDPLDERRQVDLPMCT